MRALCDLGPDYQSVFLATETDPALEQAAAAASLVVDGKEALAPVLLMSYNAQVSLLSLPQVASSCCVRMMTSKRAFEVLTNILKQSSITTAGVAPQLES